MDAWRDTASERLPGETWRTVLAPPPLEVEPFTHAELRVALEGGERAGDVCEQVLATAARVRGAIDVALAEGLHALRKGDRLAKLGCHLDDYAREVLDLGKRAAQSLARLGEALATRPLLREALRSGRVHLRAAQTVLPVARGADEAAWVERAATATVRALEVEVRRARGGDVSEDEDEEWLRFAASLTADDRALLDTALDLAGKAGAGRSRMERLEALAQEIQSVAPSEPGTVEAGELARSFRTVRSRLDASRTSDATRAALEADTLRWTLLPVPPEIPVPDVRFYETATAQAIDANLRALARYRAGWDDLVGSCAWAVWKSGMHRLAGFQDFRHFCEERLGLPARTVEERATLERKVGASRALQEARRQKLSTEKLKLLSRLPEHEIGRWTPLAHALTCIALRRRIEGEQDRQMRARARISISMPRRIAAVLAAAIQTVRDRLDRMLPAGRCLAVIAYHFVATWKKAIGRSRTRAQRIRDRDGGHCTAPGCSHPGDHDHHVEFRSRGGGDEDENQTAVCAFHHLRCIHGGYLRVTGRAPDGLTWFLGGRRWGGPAGA